MTRYIELHARSAFSFLEGASLPEALASVCSEMESPAMAMLDVDNVAGAPRFYLAAKKLGIKAHLGAEITAEDGSRWPLLVENRAGYQNLCRLITSMKLRCPKGEARATENEFRTYANGLVCLTGGEDGPLARSFERGDANSTLEKLTGIFGANGVYVELQRHLCRHEEARNQAAIDLARSLNLPLLATNGVRHASPARARAFRRAHLRSSQDHHPRSRPPARAQL